MIRRVAWGVWLASLVTTLPGLYACTPSSVTVSWTEDVQLSGGQVVQIDRKQTSHAAGQWGQGIEYYVASASIRPRSGETWLAPEWSGPMQPLVFDRDERTNEFVIVGIPGECQFFESLGAPDSFYVEYRFRQGTWQRLPLSDFSVGRAANVLLTVRSEKETGHISLEDKKRRDSVPGVSWRARSIELSGSNPCGGGPIKR